MKKEIDKTDQGGHVHLIEDFDKHLFLAEPHGVINPTLVAEDLQRAKEFSLSCSDHWTYCTNTEDVKLVNPFNILYLKEVKKLPKLREIVVYVPGFFNRLLIRLVSPIFRPDRLIKRRNDFELFLRTVS